MGQAAVTILSRRILLAVTGLSPQVLTETLYALGVDGEAGFAPTEIHLLTTESGAKLARAALLHPDGGQFHALLADYPQLGKPVFDDSQIHVIHDAAGKPLSDIRTPEENACAANTITALMAELTRDPTATLHVSIAGGRKTMGFYLGYAFSLFARPQDDLSHVLVSSPFENHPEFFFPPATPKRLATRDGQHIDTADARITLARIPVVRLRHGQPQALLNGHASFNETVAAIQESLNPPYLEIDLRSRKVICGSTHVKLAPALLAWLAWWAKQTVDDHGPQSWRTASSEEFLEVYRLIVTEDSTAYDNAKTRLKGGMEKEFFEQNNSKLARELQTQLGQAAEPYMLGTSGKRPHTKRLLKLEKSSIRLHL